ncbi:LacI family DNA-binding transcriptional regulator [Nonomuraea sp. NPDC005650]|uniref:LacI family DNA-binding transcriptional regulator n=1 Tax=Nonomuraea sp. NPDC005650 TaxID=3157045 RepID=UPI0033AC6978
MAELEGVPGRKVTRKDVARRAGVSDAVVSYTLNGKAPVAPATAKRVMKAIAELGYQPNHAARALKSGSARTIALVFQEDDDAPAYTNPFFTEFAHAVEKAARARGYALYMTTDAPGPGKLLERFRELAARQVDGVLIVPGSRSLDASGLDLVGLPWVRLNTTSPLPGVDSVGVDLYRGAFEATEHLIAHGHRRVGFVGGGAEEPRHRGWRDACATHGVLASPGLYASFTREGGYRAGLELAAADDRPGAIFASSDLIALGVLRALHEQEVQVPEDIAIVSFDGSWETEYSWPALSSVRQPIEAMAEASVDRLLDQHSAERRHETFFGTLIPRASCGPHPVRSMGDQPPAPYGV